MKSSIHNVHELFEQQATAAPDAIALLFEDQKLSYAELNHRANRLAHQLIQMGVRRGTLVGLCMVRSPEVIIGLLAILKAGGAYVPLDPNYPDERVAFMLRDTAAPLVLANRATCKRLEPFAAHTRILCLDNDNGPSVAGSSATNPDVGAGADDLAYVIYTSGSTGTPKGVLVKHRGVVRLVRDTDYVQFGNSRSQEVFLHLAPLAFDASTFEIWGPLLNGGRLALMPPVPPTPDALDAAIRRHGVTTLWLTAGLFHLIVEQRAEALTRLRQLVAGGDVLSPTHVVRALEAMHDGILVNGYGPTESTTFACCYQMKKGYRPGATIPIGRAIANTSVCILDEMQRPVPAGAVGELYIGGAGLAHGYLNNPELTNEKFVADPGSGDGAARLYRTGDRVRCLPDGNIEFLGRFDNQLKIMGHRIEAGEIETVLQQHPSVRLAVVIARPQPRGEKQLVAYVVADNAAAFSADILKKYLAERLPPYMVPRLIVRLDRLPLTVNGKVDRSALPAPEGDFKDQGHPLSSSSPATEWEGKVAALWQRILNRGVGFDDNFFDLGGTSLQLLEIHAELTRLSGRTLAVTELFEHSTVRSLAGWLSGKGGVDPAFAAIQDRAKRQKEAFARRKPGDLTPK